MKIRITNTPNRFDLGGDLMNKGTEFSTGLTHINVGGSHESNPNDGVQMGTDPNGVPNKVEEGEVIWDNYVFSKRMKVPAKFLELNKINTDNISFADLAKKFEKEIAERPNDPISMTGFQKNMERLRGCQEEERQKKNAREMAKQQAMLEQLQVLQQPQDMPIEQPIDQQQMMPEMGPEMAQMNPMNQQQMMEQPMAPDMMSDGGNLFAKAGPIMTRRQRRANERGLQQWGMDWFRNNALDLGLINADTQWNGNTLTLSKNGHTADFTFGDNINANLAAFNAARRKIDEVNQRAGYVKAQQRNAINTENVRLQNLGLPRMTAEQEEAFLNGSTTFNTDALNQSFAYDDKNFNPTFYTYDLERSPASFLRYAPALGNAVSVAHGLFSKPDYSRAYDIMRLGNDIVPPKIDYIAGNMRYNPVDREFLMNKTQANASAARAAALNTTNPSAYANALASDFNYQTKLGDDFKNVENTNWGRYKDVKDYQKSINQINAGIAGTNATNFMNAQRDRNQYLLLGYNMMNDIDKQRQDSFNLNYTNLLNSLGNIGEEQYDWDRINWETMNGVRPRGYYGNTNYKTKKGEYSSIPTVNTGKNGGKLLTKKKR